MIKKHTDENTPDDHVINPRLNNTTFVAPGSPKSGYHNQMETDISNNDRRYKTTTA